MSTADPDVLRRYLSPERLQPYVRVAGGDLEAAIALYEWNTAASGAFYESLQALEVVLRNAVHEQLSACHPGGAHWYRHPQMRRALTGETQRDIATARQRATRDGRAETPGRVVAELTFGFWQYLLARRYEHTLWVPYLRHAFPNGTGRRATAHASVDELRVLRNRIAHHEPIHARALRDDLDRVLDVAGWISTDVRGRIAATSRAPAVLARRP